MAAVAIPSTSTHSHSLTHHTRAQPPPFVFPLRPSSDDSQAFLPTSTSCYSSPLIDIDLHQDFSALETTTTAYEPTTYGDTTTTTTTTTTTAAATTSYYYHHNHNHHNHTHKNMSPGAPQSASRGFSSSSSAGANALPPSTTCNTSLYAALRHMEAQNKTIRDAWEAERGYLEANRARAEEVYKEERAIMDEAVALMEAERDQLLDEIYALKTHVQMLEDENGALRRRMGSDSIGIPGPTGIGLAPGESAAGMLRGGASGSEPMSASASASTSLPTSGTATVRPGLQPHTNSSLLSPIPLQGPAAAEPMDFLAHTRPAAPQGTLAPTVDIQEIHPELEGIPIKAAALKSPTFQDVATVGLDGSLAAARTDQEMDNDNAQTSSSSVCGPDTDKDTESAASPLPLSPHRGGIHREETLQMLTAHESFRRHIHAGHTPSHSITNFPSLTAGSNTASGTANGSTVGGDTSCGRTPVLVEGDDSGGAVPVSSSHMHTAASLRLPISYRGEIKRRERERDAAAGSRARKTEDAALVASLSQASQHAIANAVVTAPQEEEEQERGRARTSRRVGGSSVPGDDNAQSDSMGRAPAAATADLNDEPVLTPPEHDRPLTGPLMITNIPAKDEIFLAQLAKKLEAVKMSREASPESESGMTSDDALSGAAVARAEKRGLALDMALPMDLMGLDGRMKPRALAKAAVDDGGNDDDEDDEDDDEPEIPLRFKKTTNFGLPMGQFCR